MQTEGGSRPDDNIPTLTEAVAPPPGYRHRRHVRWLASLLFAALLALALSGGLDELGRRDNDAAFKRALITFAIARGLNGLISVVQGTEVALQPAGLGVVFAPGQIFDPVNDLVEQFSHVMLLATTSLGIQKILLGISAWWGMDLVLGLALLASWWVMWRPPARRALAAWAWRALLLMVFLRFAVPLVSVVNERAFQLFLAEPYQASSRALDTARSEIEAIHETAPAVEAPSDPGLLDRLSRFYQDTSRKLSIEERVRRYQEKLSHAVEHTIQLIVVFVLQTIVFPLLFLWAGLAAVRGLGRFLRSAAPATWGVKAARPSIE